MGFSADMIQKVWQKGRVVSNNDPRFWKKDQCDAWMRRADYGNRDSQYGWEIDHIAPGGPDILSNLRPLHWLNNVDKSDGRLKCNVVANGVDNAQVA